MKYGHLAGLLPPLPLLILVFEATEGTIRYLVQLGEATVAGLSYIQADIEDSPVVCMTRQAAIYGRVHDRYGAHAHEHRHAISSYIRSDIRIERAGGAFKGNF